MEKRENVASPWSENGLTLLLDAEAYDYAFSPQTGEGFKLAVHSHMDQASHAHKAQ